MYIEDLLQDRIEPGTLEYLGSSGVYISRGSLKHYFCRYNASRRAVYRRHEQEPRPLAVPFCGGAGAKYPRPCGEVIKP